MREAKVLFQVTLIVLFMLSAANAQDTVTVYNTFDSEYDGWGYDYGNGWTIAGDSNAVQYGVEQAFAIQATATGYLCNLWIGSTYCGRTNTEPDTIKVRITPFDEVNPPSEDDVMEEWVRAVEGNWYDWQEPHLFESDGSTYLEENQWYWIWVSAAYDYTRAIWCFPNDTGILALHTLRRENEDWLSISNETTSAFRIDVITGQIGIADDNSPIPENFKLAQNYPNPFNSSTMISYTIPEQSEVTISVYDLMGRLVDTIKSGIQQAGSYDLVWNAGDNPSGIYLYKIKAGNYSGTKKMTFIK